MNFSIKLARCIICFVVVLIINFFLPRIMPGDPVIMLIGQDATKMTEEDLAQYEEKLGLNEPVIIQFVEYIKGLIKGELGYSYHQNKSVSHLLSSRIKNTIIIILPSIIISTFFAATLGCIAGWYNNTVIDGIITSVCIILYSVPVFLIAMLLLRTFSYELGWFALGSIKSNITPENIWEKFMDIFKHLFLPVVTLVLSSIPSKFLILRNSVAKACNEKYVVYSKARGISNKRILFLHIFKNVCHPFLSIVGLSIGFIISGSLLIEVVFSINGMGSLIYEAAMYRDYPTLQGCFLVISIAVITVNFITDTISVLVDPRIRSSKYYEV